MSSEKPTEAIVVNFPNTEHPAGGAQNGGPDDASEIAAQEKARRVMAEATRLANLAPDEWRLWIDRRAERFGVPRVTLEGLIEAIIKDQEKKQREAKAEARRQEQRAERQGNAAKREKEREQQQILKDAERKQKEKLKAFTAIAKLPSVLHEAKLAELAKRIDEEVSVLRDEFADFVGVESSSAAMPTDWTVEPWAEPVAMATLLQELIDKINKYVMARPHEVLTMALWAAMAWVHEIAAIHSPYLVATSVEPESGKTTAINVLRFMVPKPYLGAELTGPSLYRFVDREKPTLFNDEADDVFSRKPDLGKIYNAAWTRGTKIPRQVKGVTQWFDPFCPKAIGLIGMNVPRALVTRGIVIKMWPTKPDEVVEDFAYADDEEFSILRRKLARWSADHAVALKDAKPLWPAGFNNRLRANWRLLLAIAELAGESFPKQARDAAERLSRTFHKPSWGRRLLEAFREIFGSGRRKEITSAAVVDWLTSDPTGVWVEYKHGTAITQRQVADLLDPYEIYPIPIHPTGSSKLTCRGYRATQFVDAFARFPASTPAHPLTAKGGKRMKAGKSR